MDRHGLARGAAHDGSPTHRLRECGIHRERLRSRSQSVAKIIKLLRVAMLQLLAVLISRVILFFNLNLYIPISKVDENMAVARLRNAILTQKFYFRSHVVPMPGACAARTDVLKGRV